MRHRSPGRALPVIPSSLYRFYTPLTLHINRTLAINEQINTRCLAHTVCCKPRFSLVQSWTGVTSVPAAGSGICCQLPQLKWPPLNHYCKKVVYLFVYLCFVIRRGLQFLLNYERMLFVAKSSLRIAIFYSYQF